MTTIDDGRNFLDHYGTKGMKWGVRKDRGHEGERVKTKKLDKLDKKFMRNAYSLKSAVAIHNATADKVNSQLPGLNEKHPKANLLDSPTSSASKAYLREYESTVNKAYDSAVQSVLGTSPSGRYRARYDSTTEQLIMQETGVEHATSEETALRFKLDIVSGHIQQMYNVDSTLEQSATVGEDFLDHYGTKGMKWGVRRRRNERNRAKTFGGDKSTKKNAKDLSDQELRDILNRMQMERQYKQLSNSGRTSAGKEFAKSIVLNIARQQISNAANAGINAGIRKAMNKK